MFPEQRQAKLNRILDQLRKIPGIKQVWSDDWDSNSIRVHLELEFESTLRLKCRLQDTKRRLNALGVLRITDYPVKKRSYNGRIYGKAIWTDEGYDQKTISVDVFA